MSGTREAEYEEKQIQEITAGRLGHTRSGSDSAAAPSTPCPPQPLGPALAPAAHEETEGQRESEVARPHPACHHLGSPGSAQGTVASSSPVRRAEGPGFRPQQGEFSEPAVPMGFSY